MLPESKNLQIVADNIRSLENQIKDLDGGIPSHEETDAGKVLAVDDEGGLEWRYETEELPSVSPSENGNVLGVVNGAWGIMALLPTNEYSIGKIAVTKTNQSTLAIEFPIKPVYILPITTNKSTGESLNILGFAYGAGNCVFYFGTPGSATGSSAVNVQGVLYSNDDLTMTLVGQDAGSICNEGTGTFDLYYIYKNIQHTQSKKGGTKK